MYASTAFEYDVWLMGLTKETIDGVCDRCLAVNEVTAEVTSIKKVKIACCANSDLK